MTKTRSLLFALAAGLTFSLSALGADKPPMTLDEFFDSVDIPSVRMSPDGRAVVIATSQADWDASRFRSNLWLYRDESGLIQLTNSGHDRSPEWSPDGRWIAFLSDRQASGAARHKADGKGRHSNGSEGKDDKPVAQLYVISASGGEAFPITSGEEEVHAFAWAADSKGIFFATREPWSKEQDESYKKEWKDVIRFRESERGDTIWMLNIQAALEHGPVDVKKTGRDPQPGLASVVRVRERVKQTAASPDGKWLAYLTESRSQRQESMDDYSIFVTPARPNAEAATLRVEHAPAVFDKMAWARDSRHIFFSFLNGSVEVPYQDAQPRVYWADATSGPENRHARWAAAFPGAVTDFDVATNGHLLAAGRMGTEVQTYTQADPQADFAQRTGWPGTYEKLSCATHSPRVAFVYSSLERPAEVYVADSPEKLDQARPITSFNRLFTERALPQGKPYEWKADDGVTVEGMLVYPPGKFGEKHLHMLTLIHGGPGDADGNRFAADWYDWAGIAATDGWLVFRPNYRGSIGYGDVFTLGIIPKIVSRPGKDILEGVDALVKNGIADPDHLTVGGYSYGGYMTNWLITQTTRFKAAVSGAGAVEHVANWGNDDTVYDDAYFLGGLPWQAQKNWNAEAAIWQFDKVRTPTHVVGGAEDIRVYVGENYLLERALHTQEIPSCLLIFPGEGHSLDKNPWHGKIKVREELKWLEKYGNQPATVASGHP
jgi:dipeptidyl aminopeptidase/acylaminoacyl peptidase